MGTVTNNKVILDRDFLEKVIANIQKFDAALWDAGNDVQSNYASRLVDEIKEKMAAGDPATECPHCGWLRK